MADIATVAKNTIEKPKSPETADPKVNEGAYSAWSEVSFVILPFIVIAIILAHQGQIRTIFFIPVWSVVSAVIVGQTIVKVVSSALVSSTYGRQVFEKGITLVISVLLVCFLVPNLIILVIALTSNPVSIAVAITQAIMFVISAFLFWLACYTQVWILKG